MKMENNKTLLIIYSNTFKRMYNSGLFTVKDICRYFNISSDSVYYYLEKSKIKGQIMNWLQK